MELFVNWNIGPEIFTIGSYALRYYSLLFALGFVISFQIMRWVFKIEGLSEEQLDSLTIHVALGTVIGARLGHVLFYQPEYYFHNPLEILQVWKGGLASHGGGIGILIAMYLWIRKNPKVSYIWIFDRLAITIAITGVLIRIGNLMNSEIYGQQTDLPWGFIFLKNREIVPKHPTQIYEALAYLILFVIIILIYNKLRTKTPKGLIFGIFLIFMFTARFLIEFIKETQVEFEDSMIINIGQILSIPFILAGFFFLFNALKKSK